MNLKELEQAINQIQSRSIDQSEEYVRGISRWRIDQLDKLFTEELVDQLGIELIADPNEAGPWDCPFAFVYRDKGFRFHNVYESGATLLCDIKAEATGAMGRSAATPQQLAECLVELLPIAVKPKPIEGKAFSAKEVRTWEPLAPEDLVRELYG